MTQRQTTMSPSQMDALGCRLNWHWGYRRGYRAIKPNKNLMFGDGIHRALDAYYALDEYPVTVFEAWWDKEIQKIEDAGVVVEDDLRDMRDLGTTMLEGYLKEYKKESFKILEVDGKRITEHTLSRPLVNPITGEISEHHQTSRLDGLVRDKKSGLIFALEHKTFRDFKGFYLDYDQQISSQIWLGRYLAESLGIDERVVGVIYNGLRKAVPSKRSKTPLFVRRRVDRTERGIQVFLHRAFHEAEQCHQEGFPIYPEPAPLKCGMCDFKNPCKQYMSGGDYQVILDNEYTNREQRNGDQR